MTARIMILEMAKLLFIWHNVLGDKLGHMPSHKTL